MKKYVDKDMINLDILQSFITPSRLSKVDLNTLTYDGHNRIYYAGGSSGCTNVPSQDKNSGFVLIVLRCAEGWCTQILITHLNRMYHRTGPLNPTYAADGEHEWRSWKLITGQEVSAVDV